MRAFDFGGLLVALVVVFVVSSICSGYSGGDGSFENPWEISSADSLLELADDTANYDKHFVLTSNIDLAEAGGFPRALIAPDRDESAYGFQGDVFTGVFDGANHKISNLTIIAASNSTRNIGLFGKIENGVIKGVILEDVIISGKSSSEYVGALAGMCSGVISECHVTGTISGNAAVGGVFGCYENTNGGSMTNCSFGGAVDGYVVVGGLVGLNAGGVITGCNSQSIVTGMSNSQCVGGLLGQNYNGEISLCYVGGPVSGDNNVGGIAGWNRQGEVSGCYATGAVDGIEAVGGLVGLNYDIVRCSYSTGAVTGEKFVGGVVGSNIIQSFISKCYATGLIKGNLLTAGLVGQTSSGAVVSDCFWDRDTTDMLHGYNIVNNLTGAIVNVRSMATEMLQNKDLLVTAGWDFAPTEDSEFCWRMRTDINDYPRLAWQFSKSDVNGDMKVDRFDFAVLAANWLKDADSPGYSPYLDIDKSTINNGRVDLEDFNYMLKDGFTF